MPLRDITAQKSTFKKEACVNEKCKEKMVEKFYRIKMKKVKKGQMIMLVIETIRKKLSFKCRVIS